MDINPKKTRNVTIKDVLVDHELELMGIKESIDGIPVNSALRLSEFLNDSGMSETSEFIEIQARYRDKMSDKEERIKYFREISRFESRYIGEKFDEYLEGLNKQVGE